MEISYILCYNTSSLNCANAIFTIRKRGINLNNELINSDNEINNIFDNIKELVINSRNRVYATVNTEMINLYWNIGKAIMEIQQGDERASYGETVLEKLSQRLTAEFGKGFSKRNLERMRKFYIYFPIATTVSSQLSWSHYLEILKVDEEPKRNFYIKETINSRWSVRELQRQIGSLLYERLLLSGDKNKVLELAEKGHELKESKDLVKDPFVLEFLDIKENTDYLESDLEKNILEHLKEFLLELGKGFMFVGSQVRLTLEEDHFYPDLVFYNRLLKCFVIIDLKIGKVTHQDIGQMQMYVNYYDREIKSNDENPTVGILLSTLKNKTVVKYTLPEDNKNIFSSSYKLHLPTEQELIDAVEEEKKNLEHKIEIENKQIEKLRNIKLEYEKDLEAYEQKSLNEKSVKELMEYELSYLKDVTGESKVIGDGIIITIKDSENDLKENQNPNELIVHDIDILRIVNDLKKAGAIAISINGERLLTLSKIKCSGSTIKVNDTTYGQPFIIKAIGDLNTLKASVTSPQSYTNILQEVYGIYIKVEEKNDIIINSFKKYE